MTRIPNIFTNPVNNATYSWPINHNEENEFGKSRQMGDGAPTSSMGLIPQQGASTPMVLEWKGVILTKAHLLQMIFWYQLCESQTIYVSDAAGNKYEVLITDFTEQKKPAAFNPRDPTNAPYWTWDYTLTMRVVRVISGEWAGVTP
jgi:hypothetical protein